MGTARTRYDIAAAAIMIAIVAIALARSGGENVTPEGTPNRLIHEKSPYLLQHARNPVDWYPWGDEAFAKAERENKPVFLSIGYSTCHWCHVMEHESFEDPEVAALMNETFVCIKVDREERPDIDGVYMEVAQLMSGRGGWPLTIMMTPDKRPFFAGTYIPKNDRFGMTGMMNLVPRIAELWSTRNADLVATADRVVDAIRQAPAGAAGGDLGAAVLETAHGQLRDSYDPKHGGFGGAPKFPTPHNLLFLLRYWSRSGSDDTLAMVETTLRTMRRGGVYDHVGFGFHRYSTDAEWLLPHYEKMLYDQALLAMAYTEAYQATGRPEYERTAREILTYVLRDMTAPGGGFYSAEDADSEGVEGKFYLWTTAEVREALDDEDAKLAARVFNLRDSGNFKDEATEHETGANIFHLTEPLPAIAKSMGLSEEILAARLETIRQKLFEIREGRVHPHKDDKILTDWNGLMIAALSKAASVFGDDAYAEAARKSADFLLATMTDDGRLLHRFRDGDAAIPGNAEDYAFLTWGFLELYEATFEVRYLSAAARLNEELLARFWDDEGGGLYFTADDAEALLTRRKEIYDGAIPSSNSVAMLNLLRLGRITGDPSFDERAASIGRAFSEQVERYAAAHTQLMSAIDFGVGPSRELVIVGEPGADDTRELVAAAHARYVPNKIVLQRPADGAGGLEGIAGWAEAHTAIDGRATAYVCRNYQCELPTTDSAKMVELLTTP
jgi:uncharacterized protein YyaL (SSP411 family)